MLETVALSFATALLTALVVVFALSWETRVRVARLEMQLLEYEERLTREMKQRAAAASVAARAGKPVFNPVDEALLRKGLGGEHEEVVDAPWWEKLVR